MKFKIYRTSNSKIQPCKNAYYGGIEEEVWEDLRGNTHVSKNDVWYIDIDSLDDLKKLAEEFKDEFNTTHIMISTDFKSIEIYDSYRE